MAMIKLTFFVTLLATLCATSQAGLLGFSVQGTAFCANATIAPNGTPTPPVFANTLVQVKCDTTKRGSTVLATTRTDSSGAFYAYVNVDRIVLITLGDLTNCELALNGSLSTCNPSLSPMVVPLFSALKFIGVSLEGLNVVSKLVPLCVMAR